jgi:hypothetical protein
VDLKDALIVANALRIDADGTKTSKEMQAGSDTDQKWLAMANKARKGKDKIIGGRPSKGDLGGWSKPGTLKLPRAGE